MIVKTETGSYYEFNHKLSEVRRWHFDDENVLRRDGEWINCVVVAPIAIGQAMQMWLDLRGDGVITTRTTSWVTDIIKDEPYSMGPKK